MVRRPEKRNEALFEGTKFLSLRLCTHNTALRKQSVYVEFSHHHCTFINLKKHIKIYVKIHINIAPTCFGLRPSSGSLH